MNPVERAAHYVRTHKPKVFTYAIEVVGHRVIKIGKTESSCNRIRPSGCASLASSSVIANARCIVGSIIFGSRGEWFRASRELRKVFRGERP